MSEPGRDLPGMRGIAWSLVDELVRRPDGRGRALPVVVALGPRGSGKTALLDQIRDRCVNRVPWARLDFEETGDARPSRVLAGLAFDLSREVPQFGRIAFPRLWLCALVLAGNLNTADRPKALAGLNDLMAKDRPLERHRDQVLELTRLAGEAGGLPGWAPDATNTLLNGLNWLSRRRMLRSVRKLSRGTAGNPRDLLVDLNRKDKGSSADRRAVDDIVFDAFLADLDRAFTGRLHHLRRTANCVILLDNTHTAEGRAFLTALLAARRRSGAVDHSAVVATSRTWNVEWNGAWRRPGAPAGGKSAPLPRTPAEADADSRQRTTWDRWYLVSLGRLDAEDTDEVVARAGVELPAGLPHRLTGGHPGGLRVVLDVVARQDVPPKGRALRGLLSLPADPEGSSVSLADEALDALLRDLSPALRADLVTASAGHGVEFLSDPAVLASGMPDGGGALYAFLVNDFLLRVESDGRVVLDPWLRTLLLHRLARRSEDSPVGWAAVHRRCRAYYERLGQPTEACYHDLALGDVGAVVDHFAAPFADPDRSLDEPTARLWLRDLDLVTSAPNRLDRDVDPLVLVERLIEDVPAVDAALGRLVAARWLANDPLGDPGDELRGRIGQAYGALAQRHRGRGSILLYDRAERFR